MKSVVGENCIYKTRSTLSDYYLLPIYLYNYVKNLKHANKNNQVPLKHTFSAFYTCGATFSNISKKITMHKNLISINTFILIFYIKSKTQTNVIIT